MTEKKNIDYSKSAVNLTNPGELIPQLAVLLALKGSKEVITQEIQEAIPKELNQKLLDITAEISKVEETVKETIEKFGSFQNVEKGVYALKQRKVSVNESYNATKFEEKYPKFKDAVLTKVVNVPTLKALIKADQISEDGLITDGVLTVTREESFQYIIKV